jgi:HAE1 family hydrophobic/amphiphilic exporter-1
MLGVTIFGLFLTPVFYVVLRRWRKKPAEVPAQVDAEENAA